MSDDARPPRSPLPATSNEHAFPLRITALDHQARGLGRSPDGVLWRVPGVDEGELVLVRPVPGARGRRHARVLELTERSPWRTDPGCDQAERCPGCALRHLTYPRQLALKVAGLQRTLNRLGHVPLTCVAEPVPHPAPDGQRFRAVATCLTTAQGELVLGMHAHPGADPAVIDLARCPAQHPIVNALLTRATHDLRRLGLTVLDRTTGQGLLRTLLVHGSTTGGGRVTLLLNAQDPLASDPGLARRLAAELLGQQPPATLLLDRLHPRNQATSSGHPVLLRGEPRIAFEVGGLRYTAREGAWTPISPGAAHLLVATVRHLLAQTGSPDPGRLLELGCGVGTLTLPLAHSHGGVGVDASRVAIADAEENRERHGVTGLTFRQGWAHHAVRRLAARRERFDTLLLHSIRLPYGPAVLELLPLFGARRLLYVSPAPASLARDLAWLTNAGWTLDQVVPVDQLPATAHIMGVAALHR